jgi:hypothetical protein
MATEKYEPKTGLILKVGALSVVSLILVHAGLVAYFDDIAKAEEQRKIAGVKPEALMSLRADEQERLNSGPMPIDKAKEELIAKGRMGASPMIAPSISRDVAPLQGWSKMPGEPPPAMLAPEPAPSAMPGPGGMDAGPAIVSDASAPRGLRPEAGAPKAPAPQKHP